jgi:hypothetical protein
MLQTAPLQQQALTQQVQTGGLQLQQQQLAFQDQQKMRQIMTDPSINWEDPNAYTKMLDRASREGVSPQTLIPLQQHYADTRQKLAATTKDELQSQADQHEMVRGPLTAAISAKDPQQQQQFWQQAVQGAEKNGWIQPGSIPYQYPGDETARFYANSLAQGKTLIQEATANKVAEARAAQAGINVLPPDKLAQRQQNIDQQWNVLSPGTPNPYRLAQGANEEDYRDAQKAIDTMVTTTGTFQQRQALNDLRRLAMQQHEDGLNIQRTAADQRQYQFATTQLDNLAKTVDPIAQRMSRLQDTLDQQNPLADALLAPELLSIMSGGQGSGLRMNEAEISRIVGGRSAWETLKANIQHWSTDPKAARSITTATDAQIRQLVQAVQGKIIAKQELLNDARSGLLSPGADYRKTLADTQQKFAGIDNPATAAPPGGVGGGALSAAGPLGGGQLRPRPGAIPAGAVTTGRSSVDGKLYYLDAQNRKLGPAE